MDLTKLQLSELMCKHAAKGNGLHDLMEIMLESMMVAERGESMAVNPGNNGKGHLKRPLRVSPGEGGQRVIIMYSPARPGVTR